MVEPMAKARRDYYTIRFSEGTKASPEDAARQAHSAAVSAGHQGDAADHLSRISALVNFKDPEFGAAPLNAEQKKRFAELEAELQKFESSEAESADGADHDRPRPAGAEIVCPRPLATGTFRAKRCSRDSSRSSIRATRRLSPPEGLNSTGRRSAARQLARRSEESADHRA